MADIQTDRHRAHHVKFVVTSELIETPLCNMWARNDVWRVRRWQSVSGVLMKMIEGGRRLETLKGDQDGSKDGGVYLAKRCGTKRLTCSK